MKEIDLLSKLNPQPKYDINDRGFEIESSIPMRTSKFFTDLTKSGFFARNFASLMNQIDKMSLFGGNYLRRLPFLRVGLVVYIAFLHLWVIFVLYHSHQ